MSKIYDYKKGWEELDAHIKILITSYKYTLSDTKKIETKEKIKIVNSVLQQIIELMEDIKEEYI